MVRIKISVIRISIFFLENVFILSFNATFLSFISRGSVTASSIIFFLGLLLFFSLADIAAVYINSVIIPEEKVRIKIMASHLEIDTLNTIAAATIEMAITEMAREIGFTIDMDWIVKIPISIDIFLSFL